MADAETFARVKERWDSLTDEQRNEIRELVKKQVPKPGVGAGMMQAYQHSFGHPATQALAAVVGAGMLGASAVAPLVAAGSAGGLSGAAAQLLRLSARVGVGAGAGATVGSLPVVGMGAKEGAQLGAMLAIGQKGTGALWRHGKRKKLIEWLIRKTAGESAEGAATEAGQKAAQAATRVAAPSVPGGAKAIVAGAREAAKQLGLKPGSKIHNITVDGKVLNWFLTPDKAKGAIISLAKKQGFKRIGVGKYEGPNGSIMELSWAFALR